MLHSNTFSVLPAIQVHSSIDLTTNTNANENDDNDTDGAGGGGVDIQATEGLVIR